jgi:hypothetical protein
MGARRTKALLQSGVVQGDVHSGERLTEIGSGKTSSTVELVEVRLRSSPRWLRGKRVVDPAGRDAQNPAVCPYADDRAT